MSWLAKLFGQGSKKQPVHINDENFQKEVMKSEIPVVLDVWGPNCGPCKQLEPIIMSLAAKYDGRAKVAELNAADSPASARALRVQGTPTVVYIRNGREVERTVGFRGSLWHEEIIEQELLG